MAVIDALYEIASTQEGLFTSEQAAEAGISPQLLRHHVLGGRIRRVRRGIYRLTHFPPGEHEDLVELWLWSGRVGVFSHETALSLHELSDALPAQVHLTFPESWRARRLRVPEGLVLHYADVPEDQRGWVGPVAVTTPLRTVLDCARDAAQPDLVQQAIREGVERGLFNNTGVREARAILRGERAKP